MSVGDGGIVIVDSAEWQLQNPTNWYLKIDMDSAGISRLVCEQEGRVVFRNESEPVKRMR